MQEGLADPVQRYNVPLTQVSWLHRGPPSDESRLDAGIATVHRNQEIVPATMPEMQCATSPKCVRSLPDIDFMAIQPTRSHNLPRHGAHKQHVDDGNSGSTANETALIQPRGSSPFSYQLATLLDAEESQTTTPTTTSNIPTTPRCPTAKLTGKRESDNSRRENVRRIRTIPLHYPTRPNCIRNWYSHRRFHNGCTKCRDYTSKLCRNCGYRIAAKPINDIQHLKNVVAYIKRKRDLAEAEPDTDPTPREGDKYTDEDEEIVSQNWLAVFRRQKWITLERLQEAIRRNDSDALAFLASLKRNDNFKKIGRRTSLSSEIIFAAINV